MKTGLIIEIRENKAVFMRPEGEFVTVPAQPGWKTGDVVAFREKPAFIKLRPLVTAAACFLVFVSLSFAGYRSYSTPSSLISLDVNPSFELQTNRYGRVISITAYNPEGKVILEHSRIKNQPLPEALSELFQNGLDEYLMSSPYITYAVQASSPKEEETLLQELQSATGLLLSQENIDDKVSVDYYTVDENQVQDAHSHHVSAGKYLTFLQLQEVRPDANLEQFTHCTIGEIKQEIAKCQGHGPNGHSSGGCGSVQDGSGESSSGNNPEANSSGSNSGGNSGESSPVGRSSRGHGSGHHHKGHGEGDGCR